MLSNKDRVYEALAVYENQPNKNQLGLSTIELAGKLNLQRTNISALLNDLVEEGKVEKIIGRPVLYRVIQKSVNTPKLDDSCFNELVGNQGSLKNAISLIKAAVLYPQFKFNVVIVGESGTGKSLFAKMIHRHAIEVGRIKSDAPYVKVNCKSYVGHEEKLTSDLFEDKPDNLFTQAEGGMLFVDYADLVVGKDRERLMRFIETQELYFTNEETPVKKNVTVILCCNQQANHDVVEYYAQKIMVYIKIPSLKERSLEERLELIKQTFIKEARQADRSFEVPADIMRCLMLYDCTYNIRQLRSDIRIGCASGFVRTRNQKNGNTLLAMSDFNDDIRKGFLNYKQQRSELEAVLPEDYTFVFDKKSQIEQVAANFNTKDSIYQMIDHKVNELKERGLQEEDISVITTTHIQSIIESYQRYLTKQTLNIEQLSKVVDIKIINMVKDFLDQAQILFQVNYPLSLYYGLSLHIGALVQSTNRTQRLGNKQIMGIISEYQKEYLYCAQFINILELEYGISILMDEAVILTMFILGKDQQKSEAHPVLLMCMHGTGTATSVATVINTLVQTENAHGFDMSLDSEPLQVYQDLKNKVIQINQGKGVIVIYDMGSFKNMLETIASETNIEIRPLYMPITLLGIDAARRCSLDDDIDNVYHQLIQSLKDTAQTPNYRTPAIVTLCNTGEGGALELKKYLEQNCLKTREIIPLAISDRKELVNQVKDILRTYRIQSFVGTYDPNLFGIPFISITNIFECNPKKLDNLLDFNISNQQSVDMEAIYDYLDDSLEFVDVVKVKKYLPQLLDELEEVSNEELSNDQRLGLFVHIACSINRALANEKTPTNIQKNSLMKKYESLFKEIIRCFKPIEKAFGIIVNDDEIANVMCIIKKL